MKPRNIIKDKDQKIQLSQLVLNDAQKSLKPEKFDDFIRVTNMNKDVVKIQKFFRRNAACARVQRIIEERWQKIEARRTAQKKNPEKAALQEFVKQLDSKRLSPEAFYRICDQSYARKISAGSFRGALDNFGIRLLETQIKRLFSIFDEKANEESEVSITYDEYQHALEAYDLCGEKHMVGQGLRGQGYVKHEAIAVEQLMNTLKAQNMTESELFQYLDQDGSGEIAINEFKDQIGDLNQSINLKDLQGIEKFFSVVDVDGSGSIKRSEFLNHFDRAQDIAQKKKCDDFERDTDAQNEFAEEEVAEADQGMLMDAYVTIKGYFGGKKQKFANLDHLIPGYQLMSPRSKCDSAVSSLIKEMQTHKLQAKNVFRMADGASTGKCTIKKLRETFIKVAPKIDKNLITDAMQSFGTKDGEQILVSAFCTTLDYQFDQKVNATVPNSTNNPANSRQKKTRPATASAIVIPDENACNTLIRKLDNALLRQRLSAFDAFKAADVNNDRCIVVDELRQVLKRFLPDDDITPADFKLLMLAFDTNRNGRIDENEFIACITKARDNAPPAQPPVNQQLLSPATPVSSKQNLSIPQSPFNANSTSNLHKKSTVMKMQSPMESKNSAKAGAKQIVKPSPAKQNQPQSSDLPDFNPKRDLPVGIEKDKMILRLILLVMKLEPAKIKELEQRQMNVMGAYWSGTNEITSDEDDFVRTFSTMPTQIYKGNQLKNLRALYYLLTHYFEAVVSHALQTMVDTLQEEDRLLTNDQIKSVRSTPMNDKGMVPDKIMTELFLDIFTKDQVNSTLFDKFQDFYNEMTGSVCTPKIINSIFSKPNFVKSFLITPKCIQEPYAGVSWLALVSGVLVQPQSSTIDAERDQLSFEQITKYLRQMFTVISKKQDVRPIIQSMEKEFDALPKMITYCDWFEFMDQNKLQALLPHDHSWIYDEKQKRNFMPDSVINKQFKKLEFMQRLLAQMDEIAINAESADDAAPTGNAGDSAGEGIKKIIDSIENTMGCPIRDAILPFLKQDSVSKINFMKAFADKSNRKVTQAQLKALIQEITSQQSDADKNKISVQKLVLLCSENEEDEDLIQEGMRTMAEKIDAEVREDLQSKFTEDVEGDDEITKTQFFEAFEDIITDDWQLVCVFHQLQNEDLLTFEALVFTISEIKGIEYTQPPVKQQLVKQPTKKIQQEASKPQAKKGWFHGQKPQAQKSQPQSAKPQPQPKSVAAKPQPKSAAAAAPADKSAKKSAAPIFGYEKIVEETKAAVVKRAHATYQDIQKFILGKDKFETAPINVPQAKVQKNMNEISAVEDFSINHEVVMKNVRSVFLLQKKLLNMEDFKATMTKLRHWMHSFKGNNEEGILRFFVGNISDVMSKPQNAHLTEQNALMMRYVFLMAKDEAGEQIFDLFDLLRIMWLLVERDGYNELEIDNEYFKELINLSEIDHDEETFKEIIAEGILRLQIRLHLATLILKEEKRRKEQNIPFDICDLGAWRQARFIRVTQAIGDALKDANKKKVFLDTFKKYQNLLTYYDFNQVVVKQLGVDFVAQWMFEDFLSDLDGMGLAFIELSDVAHWLSKYGYDLGVPIKDVDMSDMLRKKLAVGPYDYKIDPEKDYYRGVPTMLNSEVAALTKALEIANSLEKGQLFFDKDFGPQSDDDLDGKAKSMYCNGITPQSHPKPEQVEWKRPSEYLDEGKVAKFVQGDASANEVKQGSLGDCWFIGALSVLATRDELLRGMAEAIPQEMVSLIDRELAQLLSSGVFPPIFHRFRKQGIWVMRFSKNQQWRYVIIDNRLPVFQGNNQLVFGKCQRDDELWVPLIEKAYAKLHGCYQTLISGFIDDGLADMTAMVQEKRHTHDRQGVFNLNPEEFWEFLQSMKHNGCLMGCSVTGGTEKGIRIDGVDTGILSGHAYSLNDVFELDDPNRNPWGRGEWKGKWSDQSEEIDQFEDQLNDYIMELQEEERFQLRANDGTFLINFSNFRDVYNRLFIVNDFPDHWSAIRFMTEWTANCSGGLPIEKTPQANQRFAKNPQFLFLAEEDCELFVSLRQNDGREVNEEGQYSQYPFKDRVVSSMLFLFELPDTLNRLEEYGKPQPLEKVSPKVFHELSLRIKLQKNKKYVVVPSPRKAGTCGKFSLSFYTNLSITQFDVKRIDDPTCRYGFVKEEYEKSERQVPQWKIKWCQENLHLMIGREDQLDATTSINTSQIAGAPKVKKRGNVKKQSKLAKSMGEQMKQLVKDQAADAPQPVEEEGDDDYGLE